MQKPIGLDTIKQFGAQTTEQQLLADILEALLRMEQMAQKESAAASEKTAAPKMPTKR